MDTGTAIFVWVGKGATQAEKTQSVQRAQSKPPIFYIKICIYMVFQLILRKWLVSTEAHLHLYLS